MRKLEVGLVALVVLGALTLVACESGTRVSSVEPSFGNVAGNDDVVIVGNGFRPGIVVYFGKKEAKPVIIDTPQRIRIKTPAGVEGKVDVTITRDDGKSFVLRDGFLYRRDAPSTR